MDELCNCGLPVRYSHFKDGEQVMSCNKYAICLTYDEQADVINTLTKEVRVYKRALQKIVDTDGSLYEYKAWAKDALRRADEI